MFNDVTEQHKTRINLIINVADDLWNVCIDESELEDAILNMCINAMHAINDIGIITIETHNQHIFPTEHTNLELKPGAYVVLKITDNGCGIDKSTKEKIFDPFYSTKGDAGTGLGLSQVYGLVTRSHGAINVDSVLKQGTTFTLYFPQYTDYNETKEDDVFKESSIVDGKESILVVDDEKALLNLTCKILNGHDYQVFSAENAKDALKILETDHIDLLISDIIMPKMDGYALAAIVKKEYPCVKIQLASGYSGDHTSGNTDPELSKKILQKPYGSRELLRCVRLILQ